MPEYNEAPTLIPVEEVQGTQPTTTPAFGQTSINFKNQGRALKMASDAHQRRAASAILANLCCMATTIICVVLCLAVSSLVFVLFWVMLIILIVG